MITLLVFLLVYIVSVAINWNWIRIAHSKDGIYYGLIPDMDDMIVTYAPLINSLYVFQCLFRRPKESSVNYFSNHFKIK
jgi:hypothetical protein